MLSDSGNTTPESAPIGPGGAVHGVVGWIWKSASCIVWPGTATSNGVVPGLMRVLRAVENVNAFAFCEPQLVVIEVRRPVAVGTRICPIPGGAISGSGEIAGLPGSAPALSCDQSNAQKPCGCVA